MIPILVYNLAEYSKYAEYQDKHGRTLIDMRATINAINALYSTMPYNNLTQGRQKEKEIHQIKSKIIYSELWTVEFMNIR